MEEVGSGSFSYMTAIYRLDGKYFVGSGPVMNYYEFYSEDRLTNDDFKELLSNFYSAKSENRKQVHPFFENELYDKIEFGY